MKEILQHPNDILRAQTEAIPLEKVNSAETAKNIHDMKEALAGESDGIALAAPQIGISKRIFIVSGHVFQKKETDPIPEDRVFINPKIIKTSKETVWLDEGCLSIRPIYGEVPRAEKVTITAYTENGEKIERGASGLLAQIFQHEIDHLNGILFIDTARMTSTHKHE
jgi:peptide deformylase